MKLKWIVFDLDDTLLDTTKLLIPIAKTPQFYQRIQQKLPLMPGALENLKYLGGKYQLALLTFGHVPSQTTKLQSLGIADYFQHKFFADPEKQETKKSYFQKLIAFEKLQAEEFISIGNRRKTDIREAKQVGGKTCLFNYGEHLDEQPEIPEDVPDFTIHHHAELVKTCSL